MTQRLIYLASLIADPTRAEMLVALMDGEPKFASELAIIANVSPSTASHHLACLTNAGLINVEKDGRQKFHRIAGFEIAELIERMGSLDLALPKRSNKVILRDCRSCYDHLAGVVGVSLRQALEEKRLIQEQGDRYEVTAQGKAFFNGFGVQVDELAKSKRPLTKACVDWTEHVPHLGGMLGAAILDKMLEAQWVRRGPFQRQLQVTPVGWERLHDLLGMNRVVSG